MLRFHVLGFPVLIHWMFWVNTALMGGALAADSPAELRHVIGWVAAAFLSVLIHELGHAIAMKNYGDHRVAIVLHGFGGLAQGSRPLTRQQALTVSAAGPVVQFLTGLALGWTLTLARPSSAWLYESMDGFVVVSLFWALLNLLPIIPLDGGHLCLAWLGPRRLRQALVTSLVCAAVLAVMSFYDGAWLKLQNTVLDVLDVEARTRIGGGVFTLLIFGMIALNNWKQLRNQPQIQWMDVR